MAQSRNKVRIIGGEHRRRLLSFPDAEGLRPTPDRVRETVFNWLGQTLHGKRCLDLFAGSGALGFEAASRHAARVVMVERARPVIMALKENQRILGAANIEVVPMDAQHFVSGCRERFDVIFLDPPYGADLLPSLLPAMAELLADGGVVYFEARTWPDTTGWTVLRQDKAGQVHYGLLGKVADGD